MSGNEHGRWGWGYSQTSCSGRWLPGVFRVPCRSPQVLSRRRNAVGPVPPVSGSVPATWGCRSPKGVGLLGGNEPLQEVGGSNWDPCFRSGPMDSGSGYGAKEASPTPSSGCGSRIWPLEEQVRGPGVWPYIEGGEEKGPHSLKGWDPGGKGQALRQRAWVHSRGNLGDAPGLGEMGAGNGAAQRLNNCSCLQDLRHVPSPGLGYPVNPFTGEL